MLRDERRRRGLLGTNRGVFHSPDPHVLIADDDMAATSLLASSVKALGGQCITASSGEAAWGTLQSAPQLLLAIANWMLPGMDGYEIVRRARGCALPCRMILTIGSSFLPGVRRLLGYLPDAYLAKPFSLNQACRLIEWVLASPPRPSRLPFTASLPVDSIGDRRGGGAYRA
jgi:CheY-like chemotaxis protein